MGGCLPKRVGGDGKTTPDDTIHQLRSSNTELKSQLDDAIAGRLAEIKKREELEATLTQQERIEWEGSKQPSLTDIALDRFSGLIDQDQDGQFDHLRIYLLTLDEQERFLLKLGTVHVIVSHADERQTPTEWLRHRIEDTELDQMYRAGLMGARFRILVPLKEFTSWPKDRLVPVSSEVGDQFGPTLKVIFEESQSSKKLSANTTLKQFPAERKTARN